MFILDQATSVYMLIRRVKATDRERLKIYARKIYVFTLRGPQPVVAPFVLKEFTSLLPNLQEIHCSSDLLTTSVVPILLSGSLKRVKLSTSKGGYSIRSFLYTLHTNVPALEHLAIRSTLSTGSLNIVLGFGNLRSLELSPPKDISEVQLAKIFTLPEIRKVSVDLPDSITLQVKTPIIPTKLHTICIAGYHFDIALILQRFSGGSIKVVQITSRSVEQTRNLAPVLPTTDVVGSSLVALCHRWPATLRSIVLKSEPQPGRIWLSALDVFSHLSQLRKLHIQSWGLNIVQCKELVGNIPHIEDFEIIIVGNGTVLTELLEEVARGCPNISLLHVTYQNDSLDIPQRGPLSSNASLKELVIEASFAWGPQEGFQKGVGLARYLSLLFPNLLRIFSSDTFWCNVSELVALVHHVTVRRRKEYEKGRPLASESSSDSIIQVE
ncbi:hypothetical protein DXG01_009701 [Tephrocybe rancida]|nr:hypothetical protein DXG01_009701 [Tephrocybe rancida]